MKEIERLDCISLAGILDGNSQRRMNHRPDSVKRGSPEFRPHHAPCRCANCNVFDIVRRKRLDAIRPGLVAKVDEDGRRHAWGGRYMGRDEER